MSDSAASPTRGRRFDSPQQEAYLNLWRTYDRLRLLEDELFAKVGLTAQQYNSLRLLRARHPEKLPTLHLAGRLVSHAPDITRLIDKLADRGLVDRERRPENRRVVLIGITDAGAALLDEIDQDVRECHRRQLGHLSPSDLAELTRLLRLAREPHEPAESPWK